MDLVETALGRLVPMHEANTVLEDAILRLLFEYRMSPQNPGNAPMKISNIARATAVDQNLALAALDALREAAHPLVEETDKFQQERTFRITGTGVRFVRNMPQGVESAR